MTSRKWFGQYRLITSKPTIAGRHPSVLLCLTPHTALEDSSERKTWWEELAQRNFHVSRGTLFNSLRLFVELRLLIRHRFQNGTRYEACYKNESHCHQICTVCGKVIDVDIPGISDLLQDAKMRRFRKDRYALYIYGVCSACQLKEKRKRWQ